RRHTSSTRDWSSDVCSSDLYSDWVRNQASGCGQLDTYALSYGSAAGDLNILKGPLGKASAVDVVVDAGKVIEVVWTYNNNQQEQIGRASCRERVERSVRERV